MTLLTRLRRWTPLFRHVALAALVLGSVGMVAVGVSGLASAGLGATFGTAFVTGDTPTTHYSSARCADLLEYHPHATGCEAAATAHHFDEVIVYRGAAGVLGLLGFGALLVLRRRRDLSWDLLPDGFVATIGCIAFGLAALWCAGSAIDRLALGGRDAGAGQFLSAAIVAAIAFVPFACSLINTLASRLPPPPSRAAGASV